MEGNRFQAEKIIETLKLLLQISDEQRAILQKAFAVGDYSFVSCEKAARKLNNTDSLISEHKGWNSNKVLNFLSVLLLLESNLRPFVTQGETLQKSLKDFFVFADFPLEILEELSSEESEQLEKIVFPGTDLESPEINLINGIIDTSLSISLKTVFTAEGELRYLFPIATLRIMAQDDDSQIVTSTFQLAKPDIEELIQNLTETSNRIDQFDNESLQGS